MLTDIYKQTSACICIVVNKHEHKVRKLKHYKWNSNILLLILSAESVQVTVDNFSRPAESAVVNLRKEVTNSAI